MTLSESLKRFRSEYNLKQKDVAEKLKMKQPLYQRYESGETVPAVTFIIKLADAYDVTADYLLGRSDKPHPIEFDEKSLKATQEFQEAAKKFVMEMGLANDYLQDNKSA